jgi:aryl-alcohol dehydrogenase-like predicted oxidoreductase
MHTVRLGRTGLIVSRACLGCGGKSRLGQAKGATFEQSVAVVKAALDEGVTIIDTAAAYGTEPIVGAAIKGVRDQVVISTKIQITKAGAARNGADLIGSAEVKRRVEDSLERLGCDYVDILHLHGVTPTQYPYCMNELGPAFLALRDSGKIRFLGITEQFATDPRHEMLSAAVGDSLWDVIMVGFNFINHTALHHVLPKAVQHDIGTFCMFAVRGPLVTPAAARALSQELQAAGEVDEQLAAAMSSLHFLVAEGVARSLPDAAYRFCRHSLGVQVVLTGTGKIEHLRDNIQSINDRPLPRAAVGRLMELFAGSELAFR